MTTPMRKQYLEIKKQLWGGELWTKGYYLNTVGQYKNWSLESLMCSILFIADICP